MNRRASAKGIRCGDLGEDRLIAQLVAQLKTRPDVIAGSGDDCAVVTGVAPDQLLLLKTDCVVEGVHFEPDEKPAAVGWKAMMRTLSDFAAMSGLPRYALVTLIAPAGREARWITQLYQGLQRAAGRFDVTIVGGETSATSGPLMISASAIGFVEKARLVRRSGGKVGDLLFVTGRLGGSRRGRHLNFIPRIAEARWLTQHFHVHAMMDLSDGLGSDLPRLARASKVGFAIEEAALPRHHGCSIQEAITDGEDYELLFALSLAEAGVLQRKWRKKFPRLPLTCIGRLSPQTVRPRRTSHHQLRHGYVHFR